MSDVRSTLTRNTTVTVGSLFTSLDIYHDVDSRSASLNMAIDEALLEIATVPAIRFYQWNHPAVSFGYFGKFADVADSGRDIVRRWTGGGIVFHGQDLTYSIVIPATDATFGASWMAIYESVHRALQLTIGSEAELKGNVDAPKHQAGSDHLPSSQPEVSTSLCFANPVRADVVMNGRKIAGAAQRRTRRGLLQQGSIQNLSLDDSFADLFAKTLCPDGERKNVDSALLIRAKGIAAQKYGAETWLRRR